MKTIEEINTEIRKIDTAASVEFVLHDEISITCSEKHQNAVNECASNMLFEGLVEGHAASPALWDDVWAETLRLQKEQDVIT